MKDDDVAFIFEHVEKTLRILSRLIKKVISRISNCDNERILIRINERLDSLNRKTAANLLILDEIRSRLFERTPNRWIHYHDNDCTPSCVSMEDSECACEP